MSVSLRENITAVIETCFSETKEEIQEVAINNILELIRNNTDRPQGEWERVSADKYVQHAYHYYRCSKYRCSKCGYDHIGKTNYCPNCGADMRGDNDGKDIQSADE